jgi:hypothetical protein
LCGGEVGLHRSERLGLDVDGFGESNFCPAQERLILTSLVDGEGDQQVTEVERERRR